MDFLNSRATLLVLLAIVAVAAFMYYSKPEHQATGMGQAIQKLSYTLQNPDRSARSSAQNTGYELMGTTDEKR